MASSDPDTTEFANARLPDHGNGVTVILLVQAFGRGHYRDITTWGTPDSKHGCVTIRLSAVGNLEYGEYMAAVPGVTRTWNFVRADPPVNLYDGSWHRIVIARNAFGIVYVYVDHDPVGRTIFQTPLPHGTDLPHARHAKSCNSEPNSPQAFDGVIGGFRIYQEALTAAHLQMLPTAPEEGG